MAKKLRRTKRNPIEITVHGKRSNVDVDDLVIALIPDGEQKSPFVRRAVVALWKHLHGDEAVPDNAIAALADRYDCGNASAVCAAIAYFSHEIS